jgi:regulation of enolase protein 1 (concanavalin A-like superfamily)
VGEGEIGRRSKTPARPDPFASPPPDRRRTRYDEEIAERRNEDGPTRGEVVGALAAALGFLVVLGGLAVVYAMQGPTPAMRMVAAGNAPASVVQPPPNLPGVQVKDNELLKGWGEVTDADGDCQVKRNQDKVTIAIPGRLHDLSGTRKNAPRVLQEVEGDFTIQVKVTGDFDPGRTPAVGAAVAFHGAGLLIWESESNYVRLERNLWYTPAGQAVQFPPLLEYWQNNRAAFNLRATPNPFFQGRSTHLKLERHGQQIQAFVGHDGATWLAVTPIATTLARKVKVGIAAVNTSHKAFTVEFEGVRVTAGTGKK